ncbi:hypothetical protein Tsubulata_023522 [Turnera subulata]|uniref:Uncharacterized protein n=1 Tax=Turnera subulata TaxID=218843 RepID=A0A9Q0JMC7_9ROSI|nr:hypothetical protein Tsubulata_023522 [Turnera subulata]
MVISPATLARKAPILCRFAGFSSKPIPHFCPKTNPVGVRPSSSSSSGWLLRSSGHAPLVPKTPLTRPGLERYRLFAVSGGSGSAGFGGTGGASGGGAGDGPAGSGGSNWSLLSWYLDLLAKHPILTKAVTSAILTFLGDLICQLVIDQAPSLDLKRTFIFTLLGLVLVGPTLHVWYLKLSKLVPAPGASGAFGRLLLDQFIFSPIFIGFFLSTLVTLEGRPSEVVPKLQQEWFSAVLANWKLWIPFQFLNFRFVPQQFQVMDKMFGVGVSTSNEKS